MSAIPKPDGPTIHQIARAVARELGCGVGDIRSPTRGRPEHAWARAVAMWVYHCTRGGDSCSFTSVGRAFDRDRTTARHAISRVRSRINSSMVFDAAVGRILESL